LAKPASEGPPGHASVDKEAQFLLRCTIAKLCNGSNLEPSLLRTLPSNCLRACLCRLGPSGGSRAFALLHNREVVQRTSSCAFARIRKPATRAGQQVRTHLGPGSVCSRPSAQGRQAKHPNRPIRSHSGRRSAGRPPKQARSAAVRRGQKKLPKRPTSAARRSAIGPKHVAPTQGEASSEGTRQAGSGQLRTEQSRPVQIKS